jgi:hypothetical protein
MAQGGRSRPSGEIRWLAGAISVPFGGVFAEDQMAQDQPTIMMCIEVRIRCTQPSSRGSSRSDNAHDFVETRAPLNAPRYDLELPFKPSSFYLGVTVRGFERGHLLSFQEEVEETRFIAPTT